jgi:hypothetical protein
MSHFLRTNATETYRHPGVVPEPEHYVIEAVRISPAARYNARLNDPVVPW